MSILAARFSLIKMSGGHCLLMYAGKVAQLFDKESIKDKTNHPHRPQMGSEKRLPSNSNLEGWLSTPFTVDCDWLACFYILLHASMGQESPIWGLHCWRQLYSSSQHPVQNNTEIQSLTGVRISQDVLGLDGAKGLYISIYVL